MIAARWFRWCPVDSYASNMKLWCRNVCIPPAPVQTAHSLEHTLTRKSSNAKILSKLNESTMTLDKLLPFAISNSY